MMSDVSEGGSYEWFLREVLRDFDDRVMTIQQKAEECSTSK